jgi:hypothetical protein
MIPVDELRPVAEYAKRGAKLEHIDHKTSWCQDHRSHMAKHLRSLNREVAAALIGAHKVAKPCYLDCMRKKHCGMATLTCRLGHTSGS